jgi:hypothetical protein
MKYTANALYLFLLLLLNQYPTSNLWSQKFYPLQVGNRWDYKEYRWDWSPPYSNSYSDSFSVVIVKDTILNNKKYYVLNRTDLSRGQILRYDSNSIYYYTLEINNKDSSFFRFNAKVGEDWRAAPGGWVSYIFNDTINLFGYKTGIRNYNCGGIVTNSISLSDIFGPYKLEFNGEPPGTSHTDIDLIGCIIAGKSYGRLLDIKPNKKIESEYILYQNYPNPFNPMTNIGFYLPRASFVTLKIYNILGQELETIINEKRKSGNHSITWNADKYPSGVYFYKLIINQIDLDKKDNYVISKKLVHMK